MDQYQPKKPPTTAKTSHARASRRARVAKGELSGLPKEMKPAGKASLLSRWLSKESCPSHAQNSRKLYCSVVRPLPRFAHRAHLQTPLHKTGGEPLLVLF